MSYKTFKSVLSDRSAFMHRFCFTRLFENWFDSACLFTKNIGNFSYMIYSQRCTLTCKIFNVMIVIHTKMPLRRSETKLLQNYPIFHKIWAFFIHEYCFCNDFYIFIKQIPSSGNFCNGRRDLSVKLLLIWSAIFYFLEYSIWSVLLKNESETICTPSALCVRALTRSKNVSAKLDGIAQL